MRARGLGQTAIAGETVLAEFGERRSSAAASIARPDALTGPFPKSDGHSVSTL